MILAIDISRNFSGGAISYFKGILNNISYSQLKFEKIYVFGEKVLLDQIKDHNKIIKINSKALNYNLIIKLLWQKYILPVKLNSLGVDLLFSTDATTLTNFKKHIVLSQDMLSYENGVLESYPFGINKMRGRIILKIQNLAFRRTIANIFLSEYSKNIILRKSRSKKSFKVIPHGIDDIFLDGANKKTDFKFKNVVNIVYVSNTEFYKNHWFVLRAIKYLNENGYNIRITFVGGGEKRSYNYFLKEINLIDPNFTFTTLMDFVKKEELISILKSSDIGVFASSCENLPITLLEYMAIGLPIACSNQGPMPSILGSSGLYFNPKDYKSIAKSIKSLIDSKSLRKELSKKAIKKAKKYTWGNCSFKTFNFLYESISQE